MPRAQRRPSAPTDKAALPPALFMSARPAGGMGTGEGRVRALCAVWEGRGQRQSCESGSGSGGEGAALLRWVGEGKVLS